MLRKVLNGFGAAAIGAVALSAVLSAAAANTTVPEAAMNGDREAVRALLKAGADVNVAMGDGMTALHWAALKGDTELLKTLVVAGANVKVQTRLGSYTPLHLAAQSGVAEAVALLVRAGADANAATLTGATPLMLAAGTGNTATIAALIEGRADVNAREADRGQTPLMFAAANNHVDAVKLLLQKGADPKIVTKVLDLAGLSKDGTNPDGRNLAGNPEGRSGGNAPSRGGGRPLPRQPGIDRNFLVNELVYAAGGMAPIHYAARQGHTEVVKTLLDAGVDVNQLKEGDRHTPLLVAAVNGQFDTAMYLLERGANPNMTSENGVTPLYAAVNVQWAPRALYPQPRAHLNQKTDYIGFMKALLDKGADPNVRLTKKVWYSGYNFDQAGVDEIGATAFWRAAYGADVDAMKLLVQYGADPTIPTVKPAGRPSTGDGDGRVVEDKSGLPPVPVGGPGVPALHAAAGVGYGEGFAANAHRHAPSGMLPAVKYLVDELKADVNAADHEGNTALHHAAARGDNAMIEFLVARGANVRAINRQGENVADMANGPVQRIQPFPETLALLEKLGVKHNGKCLSC